jgi:integrase
MPRVDRREVRMKIPTPEQVAKLFDAATDGFSIFLGLLAFAGLRVGEACAVQVDDIDWRGLKLQVKGRFNIEARQEST